MSLHTFNKPPTPARLQLLAAGDAVLLLEDAVYAAQTALPLPAGVALYVLAADLAARGISASIRPNSCFVDYAGFVDLSLAHDKVINWS